MENSDITSNQQYSNSVTEPVIEQNSNLKSVLTAFAFLFIGLLAGSLVVFFWQKSLTDITISDLEYKIDLLENQLSALSNEETNLEPSISPDELTTETNTTSENLKTYTNEEYEFSFRYPESWVFEQNNGGEIVFSNISKGHTFSVNVWRISGFGYCYLYDDKENIVVGGKTAETADGIGGTVMCDQPEQYIDKGNTYVLIPIEEGNSEIPDNQIHLSYEYPLKETSLAKSNLDQILATFTFTN